MAEDAPILPETHPPQGHPLSPAVILAVLGASAAVAGFAISTQSYWIDEALSLIVAMAPNPSEAWRYAQAVSGSTLQMPLYQIYLFLWHKVFGGNEWAMRASNIPWFFLGQLAFLVLLRQRPRLALTTCLLAAVSPILWIYLDETRPYIMQYAAGCWLAAAVVRLSCPADTAGVRLPTVVLGASLVILFGSSLLGLVWSAGFLAALLWLGRPELQTSRPGAPARPFLSAGIFLALIATLAAYYVWTWDAAGRGYHRSGASVLSLPFLAYEFLGFSGFGPGKLQMRMEPVRSVLRSLPTLLPLAATIGMLGIFAMLQFARRAPDRRTIVAWTIALGAPAAVVFVSLFLFDHRPLPRHFIPALPATILGLAALIDVAFRQKFVLWRAVAVLLPLLWLGSSLNFRWQPVHAKDNYREASAIAAAALRDNKEVWWAADPAAAFIYFTPVALEEAPGRAWAMQAPSWDDIRFKFPPRVIIISKPDIHDPQGAVARYAAENQFSPSIKLQAFTIFTRHGEPLPSPRP
ncbi:MAG: hypothetical protein IAE97_02905 [Chthoniobacterales bacterium]|nr:hypothetical protein [Chthoniobacterales bacterium]